MLKIDDLLEGKLPQDQDTLERLRRRLAYDEARLQKMLWQLVNQD